MMASRRSRVGAPGLTKTQALRQARSAALVKEYEQKKERPQQVAEPVTRRRHVVAEQKKVDFTRPTMTKAMMARVKHAEKFKEEYERKREETVSTRRLPRRTAAPIGGDVRSVIFKNHMTLGLNTARPAVNLTYFLSNVFRDLYNSDYVAMQISREFDCRTWLGNERNWIRM